VDPLHRLLEIQEHDTLVDQLRHRRQAHPLRAGIDAALARLAEQESQRDRLSQAIAELASRQQGLEAEVEQCGQRLAAVEQRMYATQGGSSRDLQAMADQGEHLRKRAHDLEDGILEVMEAREPLDAEAARFDSSISEVGDSLEELKAALTEADAGLFEEEAVAVDERASLVADVPGELLARYEQLRQRLGGVAVARLVNGVCGGCHLALPATELDRVRKMARDALVACEQCGRLLVRA
jgi:predicted  nucleic acid-binding Zn-ribbon protein